MCIRDRSEIAIIVDGDNNDNNYLPWEVMGVVVDNHDDDSNDLITYMIMTDNTEVDRTIPDCDMVYDKLIWNTLINTNEIVEKYKNGDKYYNDNINNNNNNNSKFFNIKCFRKR